MMQCDGGSAFAIQTAVSHVQGEDVRVSVAKDTLTQHQIHAVTSCGGGGGVQYQSLILQRHGTPALRDVERTIFYQQQTTLGNFLRYMKQLDNL